jgi:hypothetical protein
MDGSFDPGGKFWWMSWWKNPISGAFWPVCEFSTKTRISSTTGFQPLFFDKNSAFQEVIGLSTRFTSL